MHAVSDSQVTSPDILPSPVQTQDWEAGVHVGVQLARNAVELAYAQVDSENMNCDNTDKLWDAHACFLLPFLTPTCRHTDINRRILINTDTQTSAEFVVDSRQQFISSSYG